MADSIGAQNFIRIEGEVDQPGSMLEDITREGVDGIAWREIGSRGEISVLKGIVDITTAAGVQTAIAAYKALIGTVVTITIDSQSQGSCLIISVRAEERKGIASAVGGVTGAGVRLLHSTWVVQRVN